MENGWMNRRMEEKPENTIPSLPIVGGGDI